MPKQFIIHQTYYIENKAVIFLGYCDSRFFGFFKEKDNPDTFFSYRLSKVKTKLK